MRKTKIIATLGPASDAPEMIEQLIQSGVNIFRLNTKHADPTWHNDRIKRVREAMRKAHLPVGILLDLQGPEVRLEIHTEKKELQVKKGDSVRFGLKPDEKTAIVLPTPEVFDAITPGQRVLIDDGSIEFDIVELEANAFTAVSLGDYTIKHRKSVNLPGADIALPSLIERDFQMLNIELNREVDFVALSFTRTRKDIEILRGELEKRGLSARIVAKIENQIALNNLSDIIDASDAVMVARGDLAVETPMEQLIYWQKTIIDACRKKGKPVIAATQMLHSMVHNARPTRAELSDVANAVYDGTDVVMLSEESAGGDHPLLVVQTMDKIVSFTETVAKPPFIEPDHIDFSANMARSTYHLLQSKDQEHITAAIIFANNLDYLRHLSAYRMNLPLIALSGNSMLRRYMRMCYGVVAPKLDTKEITRANLALILGELKTIGFVHSGDTVYVIDETVSSDQSEITTNFSHVKVA